MTADPDPHQWTPPAEQPLGAPAPPPAAPVPPVAGQPDPTPPPAGDPYAPGLPLAAPRSPRTGLILGIVGAAMAAVVVIALGAVFLLPILTADARTEAGARAAYAHGVDLLSHRQYDQFYSLIDSAGQEQISREDFVMIAKCINLAAAMINERPQVIQVTLDGDKASIRTAGSTGGGLTQLTYERHRWRFAMTPNAATSGQESTNTAASLLLLRAMCK